LRRKSEQGDFAKIPHKRNRKAGILMNWNKIKPTIPGLYLAMRKVSNSIVAVSVSRFVYSPSKGKTPGCYAVGYIGENEWISYGHPRGRPMEEDFSLWTLVFPYIDY